MGWATEDTVMELDGEGAANFEQLKVLFRKECDKQKWRYAQLEDKYKKLEHQVTHHDQQTTWQRWANNQQAMDQAPPRKTNQIKVKPQTNEAITQEVYLQTTQVKPTETKTENQSQAVENNNGKRSKNGKLIHRPSKINQIRINAMLLTGKTTTESTTKKLILQFGFAADPTLSTCQNASITLATTPTWNYFSHTSNLAFHDFTKNINLKNLQSLLGIGLKFIPTPSLTNSCR